MKKLRNGDRVIYIMYTINRLPLKVTDHLL